MGSEGGTEGSLPKPNYWFPVLEPVPDPNPKSEPVVEPKPKSLFASKFVIVGFVVVVVVVVTVFV